MNGADYAILGVLLVSLLVSLLRGFIKEVFSILVWIAAIFAAFRLSGYLAAALEPMVDLPSARFIIAFAAVFLVVLTVGGLIGYLVGRVVEKTGLSPTDRLFGALFGLARGMVIVVVAVMLARLTPFVEDPWWRESLLLPRFEQLAERTRGMLPESVRGMLAPQPDPAQESVAEPPLPAGLVENS